ncbi:DUF1054 domain-containing protein [Enterococcus hulanensis]|uniref:UPF0637 protein P7D85_10415 n=1 Tax=Enterococcus hulanensis TaxID=2559929 RepID=A0ABU3EZ85_9ENTE|nr:DUF1054 domain-containing protein [Enterococcus hulanensis]MDT2600188.1 DUF1054 domain-containing protein [Enterococcus hulanensis]MDT2609001.1 DUF1054 domain-containing protein [Enterococcus hulanensis]MDT2616957.1 DUF1054 domain-containing protein [Enterococcus hulanensis]MDT2628523.1 DUF1054 domain-containing protein [Enterococcus hulanensis]MDT2655863.1 DUF1054 domain-containing protein [Enterococcus hulanensis]
MFTEKSFAVFDVEGLDGRMAAIRKEIQPTFQQLDEVFQQVLEPLLGEELFIHIAQHRRRTTYPPENTWSALSRQKRGYKMEPHFQLGIWPDYVFMWLSCIDQPKNEQAIAQALLDNQQAIAGLSPDFVLSGDHTQPKVEELSPENTERLLKRFRDVKKGEFQIGRIIKKEDPIWKGPEAAQAFMVETYEQLVPIYQIAIEASFAQVEN